MQNMGAPTLWFSLFRQNHEAPGFAHIFHSSWSIPQMPLNVISCCPWRTCVYYHVYLQCMHQGASNICFVFSLNTQWDLNRSKQEQQHVKHAAVVEMRRNFLHDSHSRVGSQTLNRLDPWRPLMPWCTFTVTLCLFAVTDYRNVTSAAFLL